MVGGQACSRCRYIALLGAFKVQLARAIHELMIGK